MLRLWFERALHRIRVLLDGVGEGTSRARPLALFADEFLDKIAGECSNALQARDQHVWASWHGQSLDDDD